MSDETVPVATDPLVAQEAAEVAVVVEVEKAVAPELPMPLAAILNDVVDSGAVATVDADVHKALAHGGLQALFTAFLAGSKAEVGRLRALFTNKDHPLVVAAADKIVAAAATLPAK